MTLQQIKYVIGIAETGSLNKASEKLYVSQPSLTATIHDLEDELGITIFNRTGRGVTLTNDGTEFLAAARQLYMNYQNVMEKYGENGTIKKKFGVSTQHYSFAVKSFVEMVKDFNTNEYEFAIRETKTRDVIDDVANLKSEIGILYLSDFNRKAITSILKSKDLEFHHLIDCKAYVYIWKGHPLAKNKFITMKQLENYPCLSFEQGDGATFYFAEEILSTEEYHRTIKANDRATILNLMIGLNGYTLCSGIICEELNGSDYIAVPFKDEDESINRIMQIGWITRRNFTLSNIGNKYIEEVKKYLGIK
ncbi:MAG: LysR family transcriptional regulator [Treponema sp.]|nr:LysR family transcriptional regulator [Treponema sp.]MBO4639196.1 LysR family transcriptional regulator [Treponema sp.]